MKIVSMLPFLDDEALQTLVDGIIDGSVTDIPVAATLPFLEDEQVAQLYAHFAEHPEKGISPTTFFPFLEDEEIDKAFLKQFAEGKIDNEILPFVSDEALHAAVETYLSNPEADIDIDTLYPFLDDADISLLFNACLKRKSHTASDNDINK